MLAVYFIHSSLCLLISPTTSILPISLSLSLLVTTILFPVSLILFCYIHSPCILIPHISDSTYKWYTTFVFVCLISLSIILSRFIYTSANGRISFFIMAESHSILHTYYIFLIHSSADGQLGCLYILITVNNATMNIEVHISFWISIFISSDI